MEEEELTARTIANGTAAESFDAALTPAESNGDSLLKLFTSAPPANGTSANAEPQLPPSLYANDLAYCEAALRRLREKDRSLLFEVGEDGETLTLDAPEDLRDRFAHMPPEIAPDNWRFVLTTAHRRMAEAVAASRRDERTWPQEHYLWRLHLVVNWLNDRMAATFGRHEAPVLAAVPGLAPNETAFVFAGLVPNRRGHPLIHEWLTVRHGPDGFAPPVPFDKFRHHIGLGTRNLPNRRAPVDIPSLQDLLPGAVEAASAWFAQRRNEFENETNAQLNEAVTALDTLKANKRHQLELRLESSAMAEPLKRARHTAALQDIDDIFDDYLRWIEDAMTTEERPWVSVVCAIVA